MSPHWPRWMGYALAFVYGGVFIGTAVWQYHERSDWKVDSKQPQG